MTEATTSSSKLVNKSRLLSNRLSSAGNKIVATEFLRRLACTIALGLLLFSLSLLFDWFAELSITNRKILLIAISSVTVGHVIWTLASLITQQKSHEELALMVEKDHPGFNSRLISAVQFAEGKAAIPANAPSSMIKAMVSETEQEASRFQFADIVDRRKMARAILLLMGIISLAGIGAYIIGKQNLDILLARAFGATIPIPHETRIIKAPGEMLVGIGDTIELSFTAESMVDNVDLPEEGELNINYVNGRKESLLLPRMTEEVTLAANETNTTIEPVALNESALTGTYKVTISDIQESFDFQATINDARTGKINVRAIERPQVESITGTQTYPSFTGNPPTQHAPGDFTLFPGGTMKLDITSTKDLTSAALHLIGTNTKVPVKVNTNNSKLCTVEFTIPPEKLSGFSLSLTDTEKMQSRDDVVYRVSLLADRAPEIRITYPKRSEEMATRKAKFLILYEATDRFGIASMNLRYRLGDSDTQSVPVSIPPNNPKSVNGKIDWDLTKLQPNLTEGDVLEYWLEATDQNAVSANTGSSEHLRVRIVTPEEKRADLLGRASDALGTVSEATTDQERLNNDLEKVIRGSNRAKKD